MPRPGLWNNRGFVRLWAGQPISLLGDQISNLALPLTAALVLGASPAEMGCSAPSKRCPTWCSSLVLAEPDVDGALRFGARRTARSPKSWS